MEYPAVGSAPAEIYEYAWDELGRLASAQRVEAGATRANEAFAYDATGRRVLIEDLVTGKNTVSVFDSLVLKQVPFNSGTNQYDTTQNDANGFSSEHEYLGGGLGHVFLDASRSLPQLCPPTGSGPCNAVHVFLNLPDRLGSTAFVIDMGTSEVVERTTHQAYGALDADFRGISPGSGTSPRWHGFREDHKFTGQWDDSEVGLVYMNARYYSPALARFISPDPLTIQALKGDLNPYAYAHGSPLRYADGTGLDPNVYLPPGFVGPPAPGQVLAPSQIPTGVISWNDTPPSSQMLGVSPEPNATINVGPIGALDIPPNASVPAPTGFTAAFIAAGIQSLAVGEGVAAGPVTDLGTLTTLDIEGLQSQAPQINVTGEAYVYYHYTNAPESSFSGGFRTGASVTDVGDLTAAEATFLGIPPPDKVIPIVDSQGYFTYGQQVPASNRYFGGANQWFANQPVPSSDILPAEPVAQPPAEAPAEP